VTTKETDKKYFSEQPLPSLYSTENLFGIYTKLLGRKVDVEIILPVSYALSNKKYPLLLLNDGQDNKAVGVKNSLELLTGRNGMEEIIVAAVIAGDRMQEYGIAAKSDYQGRGSVAKNYTQFITTELIPYLIHKYPIDTLASNHAIAGYSLGGLSAMDIAWNNPDLFSKVGVFSGSFWWRKRDTNSRFYSDYRDRLMHQQIRRGRLKPGLKFWFQTGTQDEWGDRNNNGIIDSIDDTLDLIVELTKLGYRPFHDIQYLEIKDGKHNTETWAEAMPHFLTWAFGK
jgi:enterochelin esterase-like enzyme